MVNSGGISRFDYLIHLYHSSHKVIDQKCPIGETKTLQEDSNPLSLNRHVQNPSPLVHQYSLKFQIQLSKKKLIDSGLIDSDVTDCGVWRHRVHSSA